MLDITDKSYEKESYMPLWGVETTRLNLTDAIPLWGILSQGGVARSNADFSTMRRPHLHLPGHSVFSQHIVILDNLPVSYFPSIGTAAAYTIGSTYLETFDHTGKTNIGLFNRWKELSKSPESVGCMLNTVWMDTVANVIVGTKSLLGGPFDEHGQGRPPTDAANYRVSPIKRKVKFHLIYGIPAFIVLLLWLVTAVAAGILLLARRVSLERIRHYLRCTAVGRLLATTVHPRMSNLKLSSSEWTRVAGAVVVNMSGEYPYGNAEDRGLMQGDSSNGRGDESNAEE